MGANKQQNKKMQNRKQEKNRTCICDTSASLPMSALPYEIDGFTVGHR